MKGRIYQSCVKSAKLYGSDTWCLRENDMAILRRTEKAMMRAMFGVKLIEKRRSKQLMSLLSLKDTLILTKHSIINVLEKDKFAIGCKKKTQYKTI